MDINPVGNNHVMGQKKVSVTIYICERCGHQWQARKKGQRPRVCGKCKSVYWDVPRKKK